jgi:hypothetical protein
MRRWTIRGSGHVMVVHRVFRLPKGR